MLCLDQCGCAMLGCVKEGQPLLRLDFFFLVLGEMDQELPRTLIIPERARVRACLFLVFGTIPATHSSLRI